MNMDLLFTHQYRERLFAFLLISPVIIALFAIIFYPLYIIILGSFHDARIMKFAYDSPWTLTNYKELLTSRALEKPVVVTCLYVGIATFLSLALGLSFALLLNQRFKGRATARVLALLPWPIPGSIAALLWVMLLDPTVGFLNHALTKAGLFATPIMWFSLSTPAFIGVTLATIWKGYPFFTILLLAGLQAIPTELYEAANVDGAGWLQRFRHITLPGLRPVIVIGVLLQGLWSLRDFTLILVMTGGGPGRATETLALYVYNNAFSYYKMGYAASVGVIVLLLALGGSIVALRLSSTELRW